MISNKYSAIQVLALYFGLCITLIGMTTIGNYAQCNVSPDAGSDQGICNPQEVQLQGSFSGNVINYFWTPGADLSDSTILNPDIFISSTRTFTLTVLGKFCPYQLFKLLGSYFWCWQYDSISIISLKSYLWLAF